jgi:predicted permease
MIRRLLRRNRQDDERVREMRAHIEHAVDDLVAAGHSPDEAKRRAMREFGNPTLIRESLYEMHSLPLVDIVFRDARYALRVLRRTPGFTAAAILTLAVAIGVNTAVFSVADTFLLKPLPYPEPDRLALVSATIGGDGPIEDDTAQTGRTWLLVRDGATTVEAAVFSNWTTGVNVAAGRQASHLVQQRVSARFFDVLGVRPAMGRPFTDDEDRPGGPAAVILSHEAWMGAFGGDASIVGRAIGVRGEPATVVGIMPPGFTTAVRADLWTPLRPVTTGEGEGENYAILLRLKAAAAWAQANAEIAAVTQPVVEQQRSRPRRALGFSTVPLQRAMSDDLRQPILLLWSAVAVVLLVACVNLAGLLLARASGRTRELATRMALGSGRVAVIRQLIVESVVLALVGGAAGIVVGYFSLELLHALAADVFGVTRPVTLDARAVAAAVVLSLAASLFFGVAPALHASRVDVQRGLASGSTRAVAGAAAHWPRRAIVLAQVALSIVLLSGAALMVRTFTHLSRLEPGFDPEGLTTATISLQDVRYRTAATVVPLFERTLDRLRTAPGVEGATISLGVPYERLLNLGFKRLDGAQAAGMTSGTYVSDRYFDTMGIAIARGRSFDARDTAASPGVVIVSETFARTYYASEDPIGRRIAFAGREREIVGIAGDVQVKPGWGANGPLATMPLAYVPMTQVSDGMFRLVHGWFSPTFIVRGSSRDAAAAVRSALQAIDPQLPVADVRTMDQVRAASIAPQRLLMAILATLAATAVLLAAIGLHGLVANSMHERTREIGIRLALGATMFDAVRALATPALMLAAAGTLIGVLLARAGSALVRHFLWGVSAEDPATYAAVAVLIMMIAAGASILPAMRILRLDPSSALRCD